jgi:hypothetical protein
MDGMGHSRRVSARLAGKKRKTDYARIDEMLGEDYSLQESGTGANIYHCLTRKYAGHLFLEFCGNKITITGNPREFTETAKRLEENGFQVIYKDTVKQAATFAEIEEIIKPEFTLCYGEEVKEYGEIHETGFCHKQGGLYLFWGTRKIEVYGTAVI